MAVPNKLIAVDIFSSRLCVLILNSGCRFGCAGGSLLKQSGFVNLQRQLGFRVSGILFLNMLLPVIVGGTRNSCGTRPWSAGGGSGELSHHALDNCHQGGAKPSPMGTVRLSRVVPSLLVSALHFRSAPWAFAGGCARFDPEFFPPHSGTPGV